MLFALFMLMVTIPFSFNYGDIAGKTVVIAAAVFTILQVVKKYTNWTFLQGKWAIVANVLFNVVGVIAVTQPSQLLTMNTFIQLLTGIFVASGFHGITTTLVPATGGAGDPDNPAKSQLSGAEVAAQKVETPVESPQTPLH
jgi:hypothetical protein